MKRLNQIGVAAVLAAVSAVAVSQAVTVAKSAPEATKAVDARIAIFKEIKDLNDPIGKMLRRQQPLDTAIVATNAAKIKELAGKIPAAYTVDTRQFKDIKTGALDGIWNSQADFKAKADALAAAADEAAKAAGSGDAAATTKSLAGIGRACGSCHDAYRAKQN